MNPVAIFVVGTLAFLPSGYLTAQGASNLTLAEPIPDCTRDCDSE
jgi:hypothetical protein